MQSTTVSLKTLSRTDHGMEETEYKCEVCKKFFECEQFLRIHMKLKHPQINIKRENKCHCPKNTEK